MLNLKKWKFLIVNLLWSSSILFSMERDYGFIKISDSPEVYECECFLTDEECNTIIETAKPSLTRSTVVDNNSSKSLIDNRRTSSGTFLSQHKEIRAVQKIREIAEQVTGIPRKNGEGLQVLHYGVGAEYQPHFDYFDPKLRGGAVHFNRGGQRVATLLVYLNTPIQGGETIFPKGSIRVKPTKGKAVLFYNVDLQGNPDPNSLHGGAPVILGEKWIATLWLREHTFR